MTVGKGKGREGEQGDMEPSEPGRGQESGSRMFGLGPRVMEAASQLPILLITLENIPKRLQGFWGEKVDATVDDVTDKGAGFLHIV